MHQIGINPRKAPRITVSLRACDKRMLIEMGAEHELSVTDYVRQLFIFAVQGGAWFTKPKEKSK